MRKLIILNTIAAFVFAPLCFAEMHKFTSADGEKTILAEIVTFDAKKSLVTLNLNNGRQIHSSVTAFAKEDQEYILKVARIQDVGRKLAVRFVDEEQTVSERKNPLNGYQTLNVKSGYELELRNNGETDVDGLEAEYQIFYKAYLNPFSSRERTEQVTGGSLAIPAMAARKETKVSTEGIPMTRIRQLPKAECIGGT